MKLSDEEVRQALSEKSDEELYDMLYVHPNDYTDDAIEIAKEEFATRNLDAPRLKELAAAGLELRQHENARLGWGLRMVAFFVSTVFLGIPVWLAHRYYVEEGARQKARDWARWALYGLLFYLALPYMVYLLTALQ
jgi:hypothetical protein